MPDGYGKLIVAAILAIILDALFVWAVNDMISMGTNTLVIVAIIGFVAFLAIWAIIFEKVVS